MILSLELMHLISLHAQSDSEPGGSIPTCCAGSHLVHVISFLVLVDDRREVVIFLEDLHFICKNVFVLPTIVACLAVNTIQSG